MRYESFREFKVPTKIRQNKEKIICIEENDDIETPEESLQRINEILLTNLKDDLLNLIQTKNTYFFERLVDIILQFNLSPLVSDYPKLFGFVWRENH